MCLIFCRWISICCRRQHSQLEDYTFKNKTWVRETKGMHVIIHNNYILCFEKKIKRFHDYDLWLVDDHADESPIGRI
ncbi:hypothetical protein ACFX13_041390 [Malus domestica]